MKLGSTLLIVLAAFLSTARAVGPLVMSAQWATNVVQSSPGNSSFESIYVASDGAIFASGAFHGSLQFGNHSVISVGDYDIFVARLSDFGTPLWLQRLGGTERDWFGGSAVDSAGNTYASYVSSSSSLTLAKVGAGGEVLWSINPGQQSSPYRPRAITIGPDDTVFLAWTSSYNEFVLTQYGSDGQVLKTQVTPYSGYCQAARLGFDSEGRVYVGIGLGSNSYIQFSDDAFGPSSLLVRFAEDGSYDWGRVVDLGGYMVVTPAGQALFGGGIAAEVLSLGTDGTLLWTRKFGTDGDQSWNRAMALAGNRVFLAGNYYADTVFGEVELPFTKPNYQWVDANVFLLELDLEGDLQWVARFGQRDGFIEPGALAAAPDGGVYLVGGVQGTFDFNGAVLQSPGTAFIAKLVIPPRLKHFWSAGALVFTWPTAAKGYVLEQASSVGPEASWTATGDHPIVIGDENVVAINPSGGSAFFRLKR